MLRSNSDDTRGIDTSSCAAVMVETETEVSILVWPGAPPPETTISWSSRISSSSGAVAT